MTAVSSKAGSEPEKNNSKKEKFSPPTKITTLNRGRKQSDQST